MSEKIDITVEVDDTQLENAERDIQDYEREANQIIDQVDQRTKLSFQQVLNVARGAYLIGLGMVKASGESVSYFFRAMISAVFATAQVLYPLFTAKAAAGDYINAALGIASLTTAIAATVAAEQEQQDVARSLRGLDMSFLGLQQLIGTFSTVW